MLASAKQNSFTIVTASYRHTLTQSAGNTHAHIVKGNTSTPTPYKQGNTHTYIVQGATYAHNDTHTSTYKQGEHKHTKIMCTQRRNKLSKMFPRNTHMCKSHTHTHTLPRRVSGHHSTTCTHNREATHAHTHAHTQSSHKNRTRLLKPTPDCHNNRDRHVRAHTHTQLATNTQAHTHTHVPCFPWILTVSGCQPISHCLRSHCAPAD